MHLKRVRVPDFRVLKDVDITFEKEFTPRIFPLGSQNGGGKSTLLQLIFVLLHCSQYPEKLHFVKNMIDGFKLRDGENTRTLAIFDIVDSKEEARLEFFVSNISEALESNNILYITKYSSDNNDENKEVLLCKVKDLDLDLENAKNLFSRLSDKVFLAAPSSQVFLFLSREAKMSLFQINKYYVDYNYYSCLEKSSFDLTGFFTYDFFHVDLLIDLFKTARDKDFQIAIATGVYGNHYQTLLNELNSLLTNKKVNLKADLSGVNFSVDNGNGIVELGPEDLSHGELKRLSIYMWLKYRNIEDAIVLMDEIEIAFHPDWQYRIIADLQDWGPNNQYILATHSYSLCEALTPAHVKEIEPKLLPVKANN